MSLFGAQGIFAVAASTEEALERAKELKSNMELKKELNKRLPMPGTSNETKESDTKTSTSAESLSAKNKKVTPSCSLRKDSKEQSRPRSESDPAAPTSSELARGQTIVVNDATSLSTAAPLAEQTASLMTFETWKGLFLQHVQETDRSFSRTDDGAKRTVESYLAKVEKHFDAYVASDNFCENWAAVKFPDAGKIRKSARPEGCWEQSKAWRAAESNKAAALLKKRELTGLFENIRKCVRAFVERLSMISEPVFSDECNELLTDIEVMRPLFKSARDLLAGIVCDLRNLHEANLRKFHGKKYHCSGPDALVRRWEDTKFLVATSVSSQLTSQLRPTHPQNCILTDDLSKSAKDVDNLSQRVDFALRVSSPIWSFFSNMEDKYLSLRETLDLSDLCSTWDFHFEERMVSTVASLREFEGLASDTIQSLLRDRDEAEERFPDDICGRIRDAGTRYQDFVREFRQVFSHDEELLLRTKNAFESDLFLARTSLARIWRKICETHKFPPSTRVPKQRDVAYMMFSGDFPEAEAPRNLDANEAADAFQNVLDDIVPRVVALRGRFEELIRSEDSFGAQCSSNASDLPDLEQEALLVATQLCRLGLLSDSMDALLLNIVVTAPNGEVLCERDATLYASSGTKLTIGALTNTIRDDIEASVKNFVRIRDADPAQLGIQHVQSAIRGASLPLDSTYSGPSDVGRAGLIKFGFLGKMFRKGKDLYTSALHVRYENVVFSEDVRSDIGPGKLSLVCQMEERSGAVEVNGITVVASIVFFSEKDEQFYQLPLKCDNISRSSEQTTDTLFHTIPASSSLLGGEEGSILNGGGVDAKKNDTVAPSALCSLGVGIGSGIFSRGAPNGSSLFGGFFGKSSMRAPARFQFSDEGRCAAAYSAIEAFHGKSEMVRCTFGSFGRFRYDTMSLYLLKQVAVCPPDSDSPAPTNNDPGIVDDGESGGGADGSQEDDKNCKPDCEVDQPPEPKAKELQQRWRWDYPLIAAITRGRVTEAVIHHEMETSAELPKIGEFLKSFTTDTIDLQRIRIVPYGADDLFDDETAVLDVLRQQDRDDMEWTEDEAEEGVGFGGPTLRFHTLVLAPPRGTDAGRQRA